MQDLPTVEYFEGRRGDAWNNVRSESRICVDAWKIDVTAYLSIQTWLKSRRTNTRVLYCCLSMGLETEEAKVTKSAVT